MKSHSSTGHIWSVKTVLHSRLRMEREEIVPLELLSSAASELLTLAISFEIGGSFWTVLVEKCDQLQRLVSLKILWSLLSEIKGVQELQEMTLLHK